MAHAPTKAVQKCIMTATEIQLRQALYAMTEITRSPRYEETKTLECLHHGTQPQNLPLQAYDHNGNHQVAHK